MTEISSSRTASSIFQALALVWLLALTGYLVWERGRAAEVLIARELRLVDVEGNSRLVARCEGDEVQLVLLRASGEEGLRLYVDEGRRDSRDYSAPGGLRSPSLSLGAAANGSGLTVSETHADTARTSRLWLGEGAASFLWKQWIRDGDGRILLSPRPGYAYDPNDVRQVLGLLAPSGHWVAIGRDGELLGGRALTSEE